MKVAVLLEFETDDHPLETLRANLDAMLAGMRSYAAETGQIRAVRSPWFRVDDGPQEWTDKPA